MTSPDDATELLFSYGTLRQREVQLANFGRELESRPDTLPGYRLSMVEITDPDVVALSGARHHPIVTATGEDSDRVSGAVFALTPAELTAADAYEVDDYERVAVTLGSGLTAWVYVEVRPPAS